MQRGQQVGPFVIERELGTGAMGAVYRGVYTKTGQRVAIKVMLPGMDESKGAVERFEREYEILRRCRHPNIVRFIGKGKHEGQRFYAMEYVEGESLDRALARRGRLGWEEVVTLGRQLCSALQHAHLQGVIHRDIKPSNLMLLPDGTLKLTDFGIAKPLDMTQLTSANCTVGTASYMSPEQCKGERNLTHKSDLYSLGVVFYELLTGRKPFLADSVMDMFMAHVQGKFERPSRVVLDIPKGLDTLVCQLLEKKPEQRPFDADAVGNALGRVLEKAEAQQSAGLDAARSRLVDRSERDPAADDTDRDAARTLLGAKKRKKKTARVPFYRRAWFRAAGILAVLAAVGVAVWLINRPPGAEALYRTIEKRMASQDPEDWKAAFNGPIRQYLRYYGKRDDDRTRQVRAWDFQVGVRLAEEDLEDIKKKTQLVDIAKMDALTEAQRVAYRAALAEDQGDLPRGAKLWQEVADRQADGSDDYLAELARRRLAVLNKGVDERQARLDALLTRLRDQRELNLSDKELAGGAEKKAFAAHRYERFGDLLEARRRWAALSEDLQGKPEERAWFLLAASRLREVRGRLPKETKDETAARLKVLEGRLAEAKKEEAADRLRPAEAICLDIQALYGDSPDKEFADVVSASKKLLGRIHKRLPPK